MCETKGMRKMQAAKALEKINEKGIKGTLEYGRKALKKGIRYLKNGKPENEKMYKILLLTNRDSDNVGDQVIEACDIGLLSAVMKNLNIKSDDYKIISREAAIVSTKYLASKDPCLLKTARGLIEMSDIIIFGGAPMFNYLYQDLYERTAVILEIAEEYHKPVVFSAIGVEGYDEENIKCQRLKAALNLDCVKQITTRDDFTSLCRYKENEQVVLGKVSDPAVFSSDIFRKYKIPDKRRAKKKIGIFILRLNAFSDNQIDFTREDSITLWTKLVRELEARGYDYELLTSGHFSDEAVLDCLIRDYGISESKCVFNMNAPEKLVQKISSYDAVVSCRLHPSIISFSLDVPSVGIVWNTKVRGFYDSVGYGKRVIDVNHTSPKDIADNLEQAMAEGVQKDREYLMSVYTSLFQIIEKILCGGSRVSAYTYDGLIKNMPAFGGTSKEEQEEKLKRKFRRAYKTYNKYSEKIQQNKKTIQKLRAKNKKLKEEINNLKNV